ncbi:MAG TPA: MEDS domain-containing protein [Nitrosopumilaceae archaeon]|nr:MEDS domain-containing protein [Nitrosopumilaceae archaeon]
MFVCPKRVQTLEIGNHIAVVYPDKKTELEEAFEFLKSGLDKNEVIILITDDLSKDEIRKKINTEWNTDAGALERNGYLIIRTTPEWYFPYELPSAHKLNTVWISMIDYPYIKGKNGMRVFTDMSAFFRYGFVRELLLYESTLEKQFDFPFTLMCAYKSKDIESLNQREQNMLKEHHCLMWK